MRADYKKALFFAIISIILVLTVFSAFWGESAGIGEMRDNGVTFPVWSERLTAENFPFGGGLRELGSIMASIEGQREIVRQSYGYPVKQNGIFVTSDSLMKNIDPPIPHYVGENIAGVVEFAESMRQSRKQTYLMLIPTSGAIVQQKLPRYSQSVMVNQYQFIEDAYSRAAGSAVTIDAYAALIARQNQYIYYRTENNLTSLGGYYVYSAIISRLGIGKADYSQFDIDYVNNGYYGDLCAESGYTSLPPDMVSLFRYSASNPAIHEFTVTHRGDGGEKVYHTLYPEGAAVLGEPLDIFLGGISAVTDIKTHSQFSTRLLVFGDKTAISYLPFLANNCSQVTLVDLFHDKSRFEDIDPLDYDKIIFAYGIESFMHTNNPARATALLE